MECLGDAWRSQQGVIGPRSAGLGGTAISGCLAARRESGACCARSPKHPSGMHLRAAAERNGHALLPVFGISLPGRLELLRGLLLLLLGVLSIIRLSLLALLVLGLLLALRRLLLLLLSTLLPPLLLLFLLLLPRRGSLGVDFHVGLVSSGALLRLGELLQLLRRYISKVLEGDAGGHRCWLRLVPELRAWPSCRDRTLGHKECVWVVELAARFSRSAPGMSVNPKYQRGKAQGQGPAQPGPRTGVTRRVTRATVTLLRPCSVHRLHGNGFGAARASSLSYGSVTPGRRWRLLSSRSAQCFGSLSGREATALVSPFPSVLLNRSSE